MSWGQEMCFTGGYRQVTSDPRILNTMITLLLFSLIAQSQAQSNSCPKDMKSKTAAISVGFSYPKSNRIRLRGTRQDAEFYNSQMGSAASDNPKLIEDEHVEGMNKDVFLSQLRNQIKNREFVLFSYAGHGIYNSKGEWAMILPSIPEGLISRCQSALSETKVSRPEVVDPDCEKKLEQYLVTDKDLQSVFKDKKVLMFNDACLAGGMELGKSTVHVAGALSNVRALDGSDDGGGGGHLLPQDRGAAQLRARQRQGQEALTVRRTNGNLATGTGHASAAATRFPALRCRVSAAFAMPPVL